VGNTCLSQSKFSPQHKQKDNLEIDMLFIVAGDADFHFKEGKKVFPENGIVRSEHFASKS